MGAVRKRWVTGYPVTAVAVVVAASVGLLSCEGLGGGTSTKPPAGGDFKGVSVQVRAQSPAQRLATLRSHTSAMRLGDLVNDKLPEPVLVEGVGLVVGLGGRGSKNVPAAYRKELLKSAARIYEDPQEGARILGTTDSAAVAVAAALPPFAKQSDRLDLEMRAFSPEVNLDGGILGDVALEELVKLPPGTRPNIGWVRPDGRVSRGVMAYGRGAVSATPALRQGRPVAPTVATVAYVPAAGIVEKDHGLLLVLRQSNAWNALLIEEMLNRRFGNVARAESEAGVGVGLSPAYKEAWQRYMRVVFEMNLRADATEAPGLARNLIANLGAPGATGERAEYALEALGNPAVPIMLEALSRSTGQTRRALLRVLSYLDIPEVEPELVAQSRSGSNAERQEAAKLLGRFRNSASEDALLGLLNDASGSVRAEAIESLAITESPKSQQVISRYWSVQQNFVVDSVAGTGANMVVVYPGPGIRRIEVFGRDVNVTDKAVASAGQVEVRSTGDRVTFSVKNRPDLKPAALPKPDLRMLLWALDRSQVPINDMMLLILELDRQRALTAKVEWMN